MGYHITRPEEDPLSFRTASLALTALFKQVEGVENPAEYKLITSIGSIYVFENNHLRNTNNYPDPAIEKA